MGYPARNFMKIVLTFDEMDASAEELLIDWITEKVSDKSAENVSPLRYVKNVDVVRGKGEEW
jgi:hypothetical protein